MSWFGNRRKERQEDWESRAVLFEKSFREMSEALGEFRKKQAAMREEREGALRRRIRQLEKQARLDLPVFRDLARAGLPMDAMPRDAGVWLELIGANGSDPGQVILNVESYRVDDNGIPMLNQTRDEAARCIRSFRIVDATLALEEIPGASDAPVVTIHDEITFEGEAESAGGEVDLGLWQFQSEGHAHRGFDEAIACPECAGPTRSATQASETRIEANGTHEEGSEA